MEHQFIKGKDIVLFSSQPWESEIGSNFKDMTYELARYNRVLFVNRASDRATSISKKRNRKNSAEIIKPEALTKIQENLWVLDTGLILESINWISWNWLYDQINKINNKRLAKKINEAIENLSFKDVILINDNDFFQRLIFEKDDPFLQRIYFLYPRLFNHSAIL